MLKSLMTPLVHLVNNPCAYAIELVDTNIQVILKIDRHKRHVSSQCSHCGTLGVYLQIMPNRF